MTAHTFATRILGYRAVQVDQFIRTFHAEHRVAPAYTVIRAELGIKSNGEVSRIVGALQRRGLVYRVVNGKLRRIRVRKPSCKPPTYGTEIL